MAGKLAAEIQQKKPFSTREEEAFLNLIRSTEFLRQKMASLFKDFDLTGPQYNMLRILRGAEPDGIKCSEAAERMVTPDPDVTRLLDRMEARHLIRRDRNKEDRRVVITRITAQGLNLVNRIDAPLHALFKDLLGHVGQRKLSTLIETLEEIRTNPKFQTGA